MRLGTRDDQPLDVDLGAVGCLALTGPGTHGVARALLADLLTTTTVGSGHSQVRVVLTRQAATDLLGPAPAITSVPGLLVAGDPQAAIDTARAAHDLPVLLVLPPEPALAGPLESVVTASGGQVAALVLGPHPTYRTLTVQTDGTVTDHANPERPEGQPEQSDPVSGWDGARLFHLDEADLAGILQVLTNAVPDTPDPSRAGPSARAVPAARTPSPPGASEDAHCVDLAAGDQDRDGVHDGERQETGREDVLAGQAGNLEGRETDEEPVPPVGTVPAHLEAGGTTTAPEAVTADTRPEVAPAVATSEALPAGTTPEALPVDAAPEEGAGEVAVVREWVQAARGLTWTPTVSVMVLGSLRLQVQGQEVRPGLRGKTLELLAFLLLHPTGVTADAIGEALWPGQVEASSPLRSTMKRLRSQLRSLTGAAKQTFVHYASGRYRPDRRLLGCDVWTFQAAVEQAATAPGDVERLAALREAVTCYQGHLLDGCFYDWIDAYREALRHHALHAFVRYGVALEESDPEAALAALERALGIDAFNETLYRRVMRLQARLARPEAIAGTLALLRNNLAQIDQAPERATVTLAAALQRGDNPPKGP